MSESGSRQGKLFRRFLLAALGAILALGLAELGAHLFLLHFASLDTFRRFATIDQLRAASEFQERFIRHYYLGYTPTPDYAVGPNRHNSLGYRGKSFPLAKPAGEFRIVCLGGSTTYGVTVDDYREAYPEQLFRNLLNAGITNCRVINSGVPGWTSWETLINFEFRVLDLEPDMVIVHHGINDIHPRLTWPPKAYTSDNLSYRARPAPMAGHSFLEHSTLGRMLLIRTGQIAPAFNMERNILNHDEDHFHGSDFRRQTKEGTYPSGIFRKVDAFEMFEANPPRYFERNLRNLVAIASSEEIEVVFVSLPFFSSPSSVPAASHPAYQEAQAEMASALEGIAKTTPAHYFDMASVFPMKQAYFTDGVHSNAQGCSRRAREIFEFLQREELLPEQ
jgi:lysophospholipase L1-like esterase